MPKPLTAAQYLQAKRQNRAQYRADMASLYAEMDRKLAVHQQTVERCPCGNGREADQFSGLCISCEFTVGFEGVQQRIAARKAGK